jgi:alkanesulfonate monooxygenase SsuD/methylene tetrahydromethanopterin reductase-like flavin-dependent oxidoreductase (luciferase family)
MELGIMTFSDIRADVRTGETLSIRQRLRDLVDQARLADQAGIEVIALGEHHRREFTLSAPEVVLGAIAAVTENIRLSTAVTVLSTQDPVRVYQQFATLDQLSGGRAEIMAGRGAFTESFPLFGYDLRDYDVLFDEKIRLLLQLTREEQPVWQGTTRPALNGEVVAPRALQDPLPVWIGVGGTPKSAVRAGVLGTPISLALFSGPEQARGIVELYRRAAEQAGHDAASLPIAIVGHMYVGRTSQRGREDFFPYYSEYAKLNPQMPNGLPRALYDQWMRDWLMVGSPQQIIDRIMRHHEVLGARRYLGTFDTGSMPASMATESLELFATEVAPVIRKETA